LRLIADHQETIEWCNRELATNFNVPAQRTINAACSRMGVTRLDWEKMDAIRNNTEYERPPHAMLDRWARY
jgi:hypothetical protein